MARTNSVNYTGGNQFPMANAAADIFKKEDVQVLAKAVDAHVHDGAGLGLPVAFTGVPAGSIPGTALANGAVTSAKIADGTIATVDLADASVTNAKLGSDTARANLLTNGGFEIWQRGNGPSSVAGQLADRWFNQPVGTGVGTISRDTSNVETGVACLGATVAGANGTTTNCVVIFTTLIDNVPSLRGKPVSFSIRVRSATAGSLIASYWYDGVTAGGASIFGTPVALTGTGWQTLSFTVTLASTATSFNIGVTFLNNVAYDLDSAMLVVGSQYADYAPLHPADDLARCQRYYQRMNLTGVGLAAGGALPGICIAGGTAYVVQTLPVKMAVAPTVTSTTVTDMGVAQSNGALAILTALTAPGVTVDHVVWSCSVASGLVAGNATVLGGQTGNGWLSQEANP